MRNEKGQFMKGNVHPEETLKKISLKLMGTNLGNTNGFKKGQSYRRGLPAPWARNNPQVFKKGALSPNWKGGITPYYKILRKKKLELAGGSHSNGEWETVKAQYNWTCPCCKQKEPNIKLTKDHIISVDKGGSDNIENIQPLCVSCNSKKGVKTIKYELVSHDI